ncbi:unnamed protein product [Victoria cruziana]
MRGFTQKIVNMMKAERLFQSQGGPIILSQIENEYGPEEWEIGAPGKAYTAWAANMAVSLGTGVPWVMCKQDDAPDPIINACNGYYCDYFTPNKPYKPKMWTEAWTGWYTEFGGAIPQRPAEDMAFAVARFIQKGGSFVNYYMYHGGTNFGRTAGGPFIATSYDYDAPLDEYGMIRQPKWGHLKELHRAIKLCEPALVSGDPAVASLGNYQESHVFTSKSGACAAFLANYDQRATVTVTFRNRHYMLPPWSISILPDCTNVVFNTAKVGVQTTSPQMVPVGYLGSWASYDEAVASYSDDPFTVVGLLEQINVTRDVSDYLWYMTDVNINGNEQFLKNGKYPVLTVMSAGHALHAFVNGKLAGSVYGSLENPKLTLTTSVKLWAGSNRIALLSIAVGLPNVGNHFETWNAGVLGPVQLSGLNEGRRDLSWQKWSYKVGLKGEAMNLHTLSGSSSVEWQGSYMVRGQPLTWYKTIFNAPSGSDPLALDMASMGKGQVWVNGQHVGRYWPAYTAKGNCGGCNYAGTFNENKCRKGCGGPSQRWYHVPRSWLHPTGNLLVIFEEWGGNPSGITMVRRTVGSACADVSEWHPSIWNIKSYGKPEMPEKPQVHISCTEGQKISSIKFASFGTPYGTCGSFQQGTCHSPYSYEAFKVWSHKPFVYMCLHVCVFGSIEAHLLWLFFCSNA